MLKSLTFAELLGYALSSKTVKISARIPAPLRELMRMYVQTSAHMNESDLIRDAIRDKIKSEAPELYDRFLKGEVFRGQNRSPSTRF